MTLLGSLRARSPSPVPPSSQSSRTPFAARAPSVLLSTPTQPPVIPSIRLVSATPKVRHSPDDSFSSANSGSTEGSLALPLQARKGAPKRILVPKKNVASSQGERSQIPLPSGAVGNSSNRANYGTWNAAASYKPPVEWEVVPPPPPPRTSNPHQYASARRAIPPPAPAMHSQMRIKPEPVAILPVKTEDGASRSERTKLSIGASSIRTTTSVRSSGTVRTQRENTLRVYKDDVAQEDIPVLVKKKKSRLALDLGWALGDRTNSQSKDSGTPTSANGSRCGTPTLKNKSSLGKMSMTLKNKSSTHRLSSDSSDKENAGGMKEKWKWSMGIGRGRRDTSSKDILPIKRTKSPSPAPPAIRNLPTFSRSSTPIEYEYRTPSLDDHPPVTALPPIEVDTVHPTPSTTSRSVSAATFQSYVKESLNPAPLSTRVRNDQPQTYRRFSADTAAKLAPIQASPVPVLSFQFDEDFDKTPSKRPSSPTVLVHHDPAASPTDFRNDTPTKYNTGSLALRAMRSVRSMARIFSPEDEPAGQGKSKWSKARSKSKASGIEYLAEPMARRGSQESWVAGAPSTIGAAASATPTLNMTFVPPVAQPIVSATMRERMSTSIQSGKAFEVEALPRPSGETFGTVRVPQGRSSQDSHRTLSNGSHGSGVSSGSSDSGYGIQANEKRETASTVTAGQRTSLASSGGRLSLSSVLSSKPSKLNLTARPIDDPKQSARKRGSLANLFDFAASVRSSSISSRSSSSRASKTSVESVGSAGSTGSETPSTSTGSHLPLKVSQATVERIKHYHTLNTIPASPSPSAYELADESLPPGLVEDTVVVPKFRRTGPTPEGSLVDESSERDSGSFTGSPQKTPVRARRTRPRPVSEDLLSAWDSQRRQGVVSEVESGDVALCFVNAATTDLSDLINRLDLSVTPEASPAKGFTPRRSNSLSAGSSPVPSLPEDIRRWKCGAFKSINLSPSHLPIQASAAVLSASPYAAGTSTFGRKSGRRVDVSDEAPTVPSTVRPATIQHVSTATVDTFEAFDSPLKNRGKKQGGTPMLHIRGKGSNGTVLNSAKCSTSTMLSVFSDSDATESEALGDLSLTAFGSQGEAMADDDEEDSDIPDELQELLSGSDSSSIRNPLYDISIPGSASALMSTTQLESMLYRLSQTRSHQSTSSLPLAPAPSVPLPARPAGSRFSNYSIDGDSQEDTTSSMTTASTGSTIGSGHGSIFVGHRANRTSNSSMHDRIMALEQLDEEDASDPSDTDQTDMTDHTGKASFDFTKELNRLNEGGARQSFVEQLENAFKTPAQALTYHSAEDMPPIPALDVARMMEGSKSLSKSSKGPRDLPVASSTSFSADASVYAVANMDLSLIHPTQPTMESKTSAVTTVPKLLKPSKPEHLRAASLGDSLDASMIALANLNLSHVHPSKPRPHSTSMEADTVSKRHARIARARANCRARLSRNDSVLSTSSFGSVRNPGVSDPFNYGNVTKEDASMEHARTNESFVSSIPSISSYGALVNSGVKNPFGYDVSRELTAETSTADMPTRRSTRFSMDSDRSSFFFNSSRPPVTRAHHRDSLLSFTSASGAPTTSYLNGTRGPQNKTDSMLSTNSLAFSYGVHGTYGDRASWVPQRPGPSRDSIISNSDFSGRRLGRPGLGDKMFESGPDHAPLYSIAASPTQSTNSTEVGRAEEPFESRPSLDSVRSRFDDRYSSADSIFDKTGSRTSSISSGSVFGVDDSRSSSSHNFFLSNNIKPFRPLSVFSTNSAANAPIREDDTLISMLGGAHARVPRTELGTSFNTSPCVRAEKKRKHVFRTQKDRAESESSPTKTWLPGTGLTPLRFGESRVAVDRQGMSERPSVEQGCTSVNGEELSTQDISRDSNRLSVSSINKADWETSMISSRAEASSPLIFRAVPPDTPPLSSASSAGGSQSSIDIESLKLMLESAVPPSTSDRLRPQGKGHRRRSGQSQVSRISMIESIAEEVTGLNGSPHAPRQTASMTAQEPSIVVWDDSNSRDSWRDSFDWDGEFGSTLRAFYAFQNEAQQAVESSQNAWSDTEFSRFALATFSAPTNPDAIQALLEYSQKNFVPLPLELRVRKPRSRANSRPTPYPKGGPAKITKGAISRGHARTESVEQAMACISPFGPTAGSILGQDHESPVSPSLGTLAPLSPFSVNYYQFAAVESLDQQLLKAAPPPRPRVPSDTRRPVLGLSKRKPVGDKTNNATVVQSDLSANVSKMSAAGATNKGGLLEKVPTSVATHKSAFAKENRENEGQGMLTGPNPNGSLRISRARPPRARAANILAPSSLRV